jgi:hypothetical protein
MLSARMQGEKRPSFPPFPEDHYARGLPRNDLCALRLLLVHPLVFIPGGSNRKEESIFIEGFVFFVFTKKKLCDLCVLCG